MTTAEFWGRVQQLYEQVWQQPVSKLALTYGISHVALAKVCRRLKVPLPGRGYWAKPAHRLSQASATSGNARGPT